MNGLKRFFSNRNVVTAILLIAALVILYFGYTMSIKKETNPVNVPVAKDSIPPLTQITAENVEYASVPGASLGDNVLLYTNDVVGKYTTVNVTVPAGSVFYREWVVDEKDVPGNWIEKLDYEKGELGYYMDVDTASTLGNSILPNTYIDLYMKIEDEDGMSMFGRLMENIKVLVVHDSAGQDAFRSAEEIVEPSKLGFAVSQDLYILLHKIEFLRGVELIIAPRGFTVPTNDVTTVKSATLRDYVDAAIEAAPEDAIPVEEKTEEKKEELPSETADSTKNENNTNNTNVPTPVTPKQG